MLFRAVLMTSCNVPNSIISLIGAWSVASVNDNHETGCVLLIQVNRGEQVKLQLFHHLLASSYLSSINWMCELFPEIIEKKSEESLTALHIAVIENNLDALKVLLRFNANLEAVDGKGHTALHFAVGELLLL